MNLKLISLRTLFPFNPSNKSRSPSFVIHELLFNQQIDFCITMKSPNEDFAKYRFSSEFALDSQFQDYSYQDIGQSWDKDASNHPV